MESKATISAYLENENLPDPETTTPVPLAPPEAQVQAPKRRKRRLKPLPEYIDKYIVSERQRPNGRIDKHYHHKELHLHFRSLAEVERYESKGIYPGCSKKKMDNENQTGLHEPLLALTYEGTEQVEVEEPTTLTKVIINYENIDNVDTCSSPETGTRIPKEQCQGDLLNGLKLVVAETIACIIEATPISTLPPEAQAPRPKRRYNKPLPEFLNNWIVIESPRKNGRIDKKYIHKERNITLRSLLEVKRYETDGILPVRGKKKKESNEQNGPPTPLLLLTYGETGEASTIEKINSENFENVDACNYPRTAMHMSNLTASASTAPKASKLGRKRKMKTVVSIEVEASIGVEQNDEAAPRDVPINDEAAAINVPIIDEAALIDVPITYVDDFRDMAHRR